MRPSPEQAYLWSLAADRLMFHLTHGLHRLTHRFYRSDLEYLGACLHEPDLASTLATLFAHGHDAAKALVLRHRDHMIVAGKSVGTINRHLCTIRKAVRIAREMREIGWDLSDISNIDNGYRAAHLAAVGRAGEEGTERSTY